MGNIMHCHSPLGDITVVSDQTGDALIGLWFDNALSERVSPRPFPILREAERWLDIYFSGRKPESMPRLSPVGSPFRLAVWRILLDIPWGQVVTYGDIARRLEAERGGRVSAQAVGGAVGHNPISLMIPCHRVVGTNGSLTGYGGGIARKVKLLELERADMHGLFVPKKETAL